MNQTLRDEINRLKAARDNGEDIEDGLVDLQNYALGQIKYAIEKAEGILTEELDGMPYDIHMTFDYEAEFGEVTSELDELPESFPLIDMDADEEEEPKKQLRYTMEDGSVIQDVPAKAFIRFIQSLGTERLADMKIEKEGVLLVGRTLSDDEWQRSRQHFVDGDFFIYAPGIRRIKKYSKEIIRRLDLDITVEQVFE